jgi:hypothetical protein
VGRGITRDPALDLPQVGRQVVAQMDLGGLAGRQEHVVKGGTDADEEHGLARRRVLHGLDEERDRPPFVRLDGAVVVRQVLARHPVRLEGGVGAGITSAQERADPWASLY